MPVQVHRRDTQIRTAAEDVARVLGNDALAVAAILDLMAALVPPEIGNFALAAVEVRRAVGKRAATIAAAKATETPPTVADPIESFVAREAGYSGCSHAIGDIPCELPAGHAGPCEGVNRAWYYDFRGREPLP